MNKEESTSLDGILESIRKLTEELTELEHTLATIVGAETTGSNSPDRTG